MRRRAGSGQSGPGSRKRRPEPRHRSAVRDAARYYSDLTSEYASYGGEARGWNYGVWESGTETHQQALLGANDLLLRDLAISSATRILDVGCGSGGFALWAASRFGCKVTGVTICEGHVELARASAAARRLEARCEFRAMDMDDLSFPSASFDVVVNQESYCCSRKKRRYPSEVFRILSAGGVWSCIDFTLREGRLSGGDRGDLATVLAGFHLPSLARQSETTALLERAGFVDLEARDLTPLVLPTAVMIMNASYLPMKLALSFPKNHLHSDDRVREENVRGHFRAGMAYSAGLYAGLFQQVFYRGRKAR